MSRSLAAGAFLALLVLAVIAAWISPADFWPGYAVAVVFWMQVTLGCLSIGLLHPMVGGRWGWWIGRELHAAFATIGVVVAAMAPLVLAAGFVYPWARPDAELNPHQARYLSPAFVLLRAAACWMFFGLAAAWLVRGYRRTARNPLEGASPRLAALGMVIFWIAATTVFIDGMMSVDPAWSSTIFSAMQIAGSAAAGFAWLVLIRGWQVRRRFLDETELQSLHDAANLMLAANLLWVYCAFSQFLIIWSGNLPHEVSWYAARQTPLWRGLAVVIVFAHFVIPFACLLSRAVKRNPANVAGVAGLILAARLLDVGWTILPSCPVVGWWTGICVAVSAAAIGIAWITATRLFAATLPVVFPSEAAAARHVDVTEPLTTSL